MLTTPCTKTVQHHRLNLAPQRCNTIQTVMHQNGATFQTFETGDLAPFFVQHQPSFLAPQRCKVTCTILVQHRKTEPTYVGTDNRSRHALRARRLIFPYRELPAQSPKQLNPRGNQQTARAEIGAGRHAR